MKYNSRRRRKNTFQQENSLKKMISVSIKKKKERKPKNVLENTQALNYQV